MTTELLAQSVTSTWTSPMGGSRDHPSRLAWVTVWGLKGARDHLVVAHRAWVTVWMTQRGP